MSVPDDIVAIGKLQKCSICGTNGRIQLVAYNGDATLSCCRGCNCLARFTAGLEGHWYLWSEPRAQMHLIDAKKVDRSYAGRKGFQTRMERGIYPHEMCLGDALRMAASMMRLR